ncbi:leucine-rich repeat domain-containing protein [Tenacibaculum sp. 190524A02b]|uniref:leucine-rich repeat domain-containing protein n=1 Tax=Tenacibaculum vairaonense TaxID=3137860 RepID=UPI0031FB516D
MRKLLLFFLYAIPLTLSSQTVTFNDSNFKSSLVANSQINTNNDSEIQVSEANAFSGSIDVSNKNISDLTGIEFFTNAISLACYSNQLTSLDLSKNTKLQYLYCYSNQLTSIDVTKNTGLVTFYCYNNDLTSIDISNNLSLKYFDCSSNNITTLDVSKNTSLSKIYCHTNKLSEIDVTNNSKLSLFFCYNNFQISSLDVSQNPELTNFGCGGNKLTSLDLSNCPKLTKLYCAVNNLTSLNIANGNNTNFQEIEANANNSLSCINVDNSSYSTSNWTGALFKFDSVSNFSESCTANINEYNLSRIKTYPIPFKNELKIDINKDQLQKLSLIDTSGKVVMSKNNTNTIDTSVLSKGVYTLVLRTKTSFSSQKVIKM